MSIGFGVLGSLEVSVQGEPVTTLGGRKQRALLGALLVHANAALPPERLVDDVWGEHPPTAPLRSVQVYVSALRTAFGAEAGVLQTTSQGYRLAVESGQLDAQCFELAARTAKDLLARGEAAEAAEAASGGLALWRGRAFGDLADFPFARAEVTRLEALRLEVLDDRFDAELALGHHRRVIGELEGLVGQSPLRERSPGQLMLALHRSGRQADALAVFRAGRRLLVDEVGLEPGRQLQELHQAVLRDDPGLLVEPVELRMRRHLPRPATPLIGRRTEIEEVTAMLRGPDVRLVTATGPGGTGKTRLAVQAAHELADAFADGVYFVGLAELRDPDLLVSSVASALGVDEVPDQPLQATLHTQLADRRLLLLLDNFEHLDEAAPLVAQLLSAAPGVKVLATSRSRLRIYGEQDYPVPQLALQEEAVALFAARARAADPAFRLTERVAEAVTEICRRLDCLALAIELAAARVTEFTPEQMVTAFPRRLELAASGPRDLPARQQALRAAIDWSYRLLGADEQRIFARLAVFVGGCTGEAARVVCGASVRQLSSLAATSLVRRRPGPDGPRFDMLETIREYGLERPEDWPAPAGDDVRAEHARYFLDLAETAADKLRGPDQMRWMARLEMERDNVRAALTYLLDHPVPPAVSPPALRLAAALGSYWYKTGSIVEGATWLERALADASAAPDVLRARALHGLGILVAEQGDMSRAQVHFEASGALFRTAGELAWLARSLNSQGGNSRDMGDPVRAEPLFAESLEIRRRLGDDQASLAIVLGNLAIVALDRHDLARARTLGEECLAMAEGSDQWVHAATLQLLADVAVAQGEVSRAGELLRRGLPSLRQMGAYRLTEYLDSCAGLACAVGECETAARLTGAADAALEGLGARMVPADVVMRERRIAAARETLGTARVEALQRDGRALEPGRGSRRCSR